MCGIAGIFHYERVKPVDPRRVERMADALAHRGPDGSGVWTAPGVGLGHRRLSVIDLEGSPQPMHSADGRAVIVFNGEIYNYRELRRELIQDGAQFHTDGDTEVILAAWRKWGPDCLHRLEGMFVFALYDCDRRQLFLARGWGSNRFIARGSKAGRWPSRASSRACSPIRCCAARSIRWRSRIT